MFQALTEAMGEQIDAAGRLCKISAIKEEEKCDIQKVDELNNLENFKDIQIGDNEESSNDKDSKTDEA